MQEAMESKPRGEQTGEWVKEAGKSEYLTVIAWIRDYVKNGVILLFAFDDLFARNHLCPDQ